MIQSAIVLSAFAAPGDPSPEAQPTGGAVGPPAMSSGAATPPTTRPAALDAALEKYARGDYAGAAALLEAPYKQGGSSIQLRLILARAYIHLDRAADALAVLKSIHADDKENGEANSLTGGILLQRRQNAEALEFLKTAHRLKKDATTASALGRCHYALGQFAKAKPLLEEAAAEDVRNPDNSLILGKICLARGLGNLAEKRLLSAQDAGLDSQELHLLLVQAYLMQHKYVGPIVVRSLSGEPKPGAILEGMMVLGPVPGVPGQYRLCQKLCGLYEGYQILRRDPRNAQGRYAVARGWFAAAELDEAARHLAELAAVEPDSRRVLDLRAGLLIARKDFAALKALLATPPAQKAFGPDGVAERYYQAGMALRSEGRRDEALALLAQAEKLQPTSGQVMRAMAGLHLAMGKRDDAKRYYARMIELFPDAGDIDELRNTLKSLGGTVVEEAWDDSAEEPKDAEDGPTTRPAAPTRQAVPAKTGKDASDDSAARDTE
jgi:tetratricopeptide (TPR) repeat protein